MLPATLSDRQRREIAFYRDYAPHQQVERIDLEPVMGRAMRPWNPYWYVYQCARERFISRDQRLLDFGCGVGVAAVRFARLGFRVEGFDLSKDNLTRARRLATEHGCAERCRFRAMAAEQLDYADNTFDLIAGIDILHHVEIPRAVAEAHRVLKPGGVAIFKEHIQAPLVEPLRNSTLMRKLVPADKSLDHHITEDERKLTRGDLTVIQRQFTRVEISTFTLLSRFDRLLPRSNDAMRRRLQRLDHRLMAACPPLRRFAGTVVMTCDK